MVCRGKGSLNPDLSLYCTNEENKDFCLYKQLVKSMNGVRIVQHTYSNVKQENQTSVSSDRRYRISPAIKAMEAGISIPDSISDNYKKEIVEIRTKRYL